MRSLGKKIIATVLTALARLTLFLHRPKIVAITGSVGKTTTKEYITVLLRQAGCSVRSSPKSYNDTFGVPLSILGLQSAGRNPFLWCILLIRGVKRALTFHYGYVVLEVGLEFPGDITEITSWLTPETALLTKLPATPVHREHFKDTESLYKEKIALLKAVKREGCALYNKADSIATEQVENETIKARLQAYNGEESPVRYISHTIHYENNTPVGTDVVIAIDGKQEPFYLPEILGQGSAQAAVAAIATVKTILPEIAVQTMRQALATKTPTPGRMRLLPGIEGSTIIDDSYNASPIAMYEALRTLESIEGKRKVVLLGEMAQLGDATEAEHAKVSEMAQRVANTFIAVDTDKFGTEQQKTREHAIQEATKLADLDTIFLCKGSQVARMEKIVEALLSSSLQPEEVLVRQERQWKCS